MSPAKLPELVTGLVYAVAPMAAALHGLRDGDAVTAAAYAVTAMGVGMGLVIGGSLLGAWWRDRQALEAARVLAAQASAGKVPPPGTVVRHVTRGRRGVVVMRGEDVMVEHGLSDSFFDPWTPCWKPAQ